MKDSTTDYLTSGEVKSKKKSGEKIQIVDVRSPEEFTEKHIPGAVNLPLDQLASASAGFDKDTMYITACGKGCGRSAGGAELL